MSTINNLSELKQFLSERPNSCNSSHISQISDICKTNPCILGIDEAGRGPVLGPMVYGIAFCPLIEEQLPKTLGCDDSKALTEEKRNELFEKICENSDKIGWAVEVIAPNSICNSMLNRQKHSLNQVSMDSAIHLAKMAIEAGVNVQHIYVDTVGPPEKYQAYLKTIFTSCDVTVAKKADSLYPIVSAASICAKVTRDHALNVWTFQEGLELKSADFGSGYPADPVTKQFLQNYCDPVFGFPQLVRFSWATATDILDKKAFFVEFDDSEESNSPLSDNLSITSFFKFEKKSKDNNFKHDFFTQRSLSRNVKL